MLYRISALFLWACSMHMYRVVPKSVLRRQTFLAEFTLKIPLISVSLFCRLTPMNTSLVLVHMLGVKIWSFAKLALVLPVFRPLQFWWRISGWVVSLVVGVQLFNWIVVTLAYLTDDVTTHLNAKKNILIKIREWVLTQVILYSDKVQNFAVLMNSNVNIMSENP